MEIDLPGISLSIPIGSSSFGDEGAGKVPAGQGESELAAPRHSEEMVTE